MEGKKKKKKEKKNHSFTLTHESITEELKPAVEVTHTSEHRSCVKVDGGGRPGLPVPNSPYGICGRKATLNRAQELCESPGGRPGLPSLISQRFLWT